VREELTRADPDSAGGWHDLARSLRRIGVIAAWQDCGEEALAAFDRGLRIMQSLVADAPDDADRQRDLAWFEEQIEAVVAKTAAVGPCPLLAQSRHAQCADECPLLGVKRTWRGLVSMSANDPKRTFKFWVLCWS
jgi:hypothetical protein